MALDLKTLLSKFSKTESMATIEVVKTSVHPNRDWKIMLILFSLISLIIMLGSLYLFVKVEGGEMYEVVDAGVVASVTIDRDQLAKVIQEYTERKNQLEILKQRPIGNIDPSL